MRKLDVLFLLTVIALAAFAFRPSPNPEERLYGTWEFRDGEKSATVTFNKDHGLAVVEKGPNGEAHQATYQTDFTVQPAHLDLTLEGSKKVQTIFEFTPEGKLRLMDSDPGKPRPTRFDEHTLELTKVR